MLCQLVTEWMSRDFPQESLEVYQLHQPCLAMYNPIHLSSWQSSYVVSNTAGTVFHIKNYCTVKDALSLESSSASLGFPLATITLFTGNALKKKMSKEILLGLIGIIALNGRPFDQPLLHKQTYIRFVWRF